MKKISKIIYIILTILVLLVTLDFLSIALRKKPLFILDRDKCDCVDKTYYGLLYNTYYCGNSDKVYVMFKGKKFTCEVDKNIKIIGIITDIKDNYIVIEGVSDNNYLGYKMEGHITLSNNPKIIGANNLIVGQMIKSKVEGVQEIYPPLITVSEIEVIYKDFTIIDKMEENKNLVCAEALESFYEDDNYTYYYTCVKSNYVIVKYKNGTEQTVKEALKKKKITIEDVINSGIKIYKEEK